MGSLGQLYIDRVTAFNNQVEEGYDKTTEEYPDVRSDAVANMSYHVHQPKAEQTRQCFYTFGTLLLTDDTSSKILGTSNLMRLKAEGDFITVMFEPRPAAQAGFTNGYEQLNLEGDSLYIPHS